MFRKESNFPVAKEALRKGKLIEENGTIIFQSRLALESAVDPVDLDLDLFLDTPILRSFLPVIDPNSEVFFAIVLHLHMNVVPHAGVHKITTGLHQYVHPLGMQRAKAVITAVKAACVKCRKLGKKTLELRLAPHPSERTMIAPPFYNVMMDVVFGFKFQDAFNVRRSRPGYMLAMVCILTGATAYYAMETLRTESVVQVLERHGARHGIPNGVFVDSGTQLIALNSVTFSLKRLNSLVQDSLGFKISVATPKSHVSMGRVERRVRTLRSALESMVETSAEYAMTPLQWETVGAKIANSINSFPMSRSDGSPSVNDVWNILTPNRLMLGRNQNRSLDSSMILRTGLPSKLLDRNRKVQEIWYTKLVENMHELIPQSTNDSKDSPPPSVDDIVWFVFDDNTVRPVYRIGKVVAVSERARRIKTDGRNSSRVSTCDIIYFSGTDANGTNIMKTVTRSVRQVIILCGSKDVAVYSREFYENMTMTDPLT